MGDVKSTLALARATYQDLVRRQVYYLLLISFAAMIYLSRHITLFSFYQEMNLVREMGMATITFFGFLVVLLFSGSIVTSELEDRTAVTLLTKPISRASFLLGKFLGLVAAILPGVLILTCLLFLTLWLMASPALLDNDALMQAMTDPEQNPEPIPLLRDPDSMWGEVPGVATVIWRYFILRNGGVVLQGALLSYLQIVLIAAFGISFAAFFPVVVGAASTALLFILGNISSYMVAAVEQWNVGPLTAAGRALYYLLPNLGYFNLQTYYSEGKIITSRYLGFAAVYALTYTVAVFLVSCSAFRRREIR